MIGTETELRREVTRIGLSYVGTQKGDKNHTGLVDIYNENIKPNIPNHHTLLYEESYCMAAQSDFNLLAGTGDVFPLECGCYEALEKAKDMKCWNENDAYICKPGDFIMLAQESKAEDNLNGPYHIEMVYSIDRNREVFLCVNANDSNHAISLAEIPFDGKKIRGFIVPNYTASACYKEGEPMNATVLDTCTLRIGASNDLPAHNIEMMDSLGVRSTLYPGERVLVIEQENGWCKLQVEGRYEWFPWVEKRYLALDEDGQAPAVYGQATTSVYLRQGPAAIHPKCNICLPDGRGIRNTLHEGEKVKIIGEKNGWYQLEIVGDYTWTPWVSGKYFKKVN